MSSNTCPRCGVEMEARELKGATVRVCPEEHGIFLSRADLGALIESENDWHRHTGQHTAPMPRITPDMTAPPPSTKRYRAWVETLFG